MTNLATCPCCSGKIYATCCEPFHKGIKPEDALQLMRSRYSAYFLNIADYILISTHPASPHYVESPDAWKRSISQFSQNSLFKKLKILDFKQNKDLATVTFTAYLSQGTRDATFTERSYFEKVGDRWLYHSGRLAQGYQPNLVSTKPLRVLPLAYYGDPILTTKAFPVLEITNDIQVLVKDMIATMDALGEASLAAPQVHHPLRLFVMRKPIEGGKDKFELGDTKVFINPKLSLPSNETWKASEHCMSIPTIYALVERPREIHIEYTALDGKVMQEQFSGSGARILMHENDHIDGALFIDRLEVEERVKLHSSLQNLKERVHGRCRV